MTGGVKIASSYFSNNADFTSIKSDSGFLSVNNAGTPDLIVMTAVHFGGGNETMAGAFTWEELI